MANAAVAAQSLTNVLLDEVTISNGTTFAQTKYWDSANWIPAAASINGNLIVDGTILADKLAANSITGNKIAANVELETPLINGGEMKLAGGACQIVSVNDAGIIRFNGGGDNGRAHGGQLDLFGTGYSDAAFRGALLLTPGDHANAHVRIRDRDGADRIQVRADTVVQLSNTVVAGTLGVSSQATFSGAAAFNNLATFNAHALLAPANLFYLHATDNGTYIKEEWGIVLRGDNLHPAQVHNSSLALCDVGGASKGYGAGRLYFKEGGAGGEADDYYLWVDSSGDLQFHKGGSGNVFIA